MLFGLLLLLGPECGGDNVIVLNCFFFLFFFIQGRFLALQPMLLHEGSFKVTWAGTAVAAPAVAAAAPTLVIRALTQKPRKYQLKPAYISHWVGFGRNMCPL